MEEKKTRRNKRILIISAMLVLLIALLCFGGTTFAKYITSKETGTQQATVAKWGFVVTVNTDDLFSDQYNAGEIVKTSGGTVDVKADTSGSKVVAPGTKGSMTITINGQAEVDAKIALLDKDGAEITDVDTWITDNVKDVSLSKAAVGTDGDDDYEAAVDYKPVKWTISGVDTENVANGTTLADCLTALMNDVNALGTNGVISAGSIAISKTYTLEWEWAFEGSNATENEYDTLLGYAANGGLTQDTSATTIGDIQYNETTGDLKVITEVGDTEASIDYTAKIAIGFEFGISVVQVQNANA